MSIKLDANKIKLDEKSDKNILIYYTRSVTIKKDLKIYSLNPLYLIFTNVNGYFEEINENESLTLVSTNESKDEKYMKIKFDTDDKLPLNEKIEIS